MKLIFNLLGRLFILGFGILLASAGYLQKDGYALAFGFFFTIIGFLSTIGFIVDSEERK